MEKKSPWLKITEENKWILLILLLAVFFWIILVQTLSIRCGSGLGIPSEDGYTNLLFAKRWAQGHPYQFNIGDKPSTAAPDHLYPLILSIGWLIGFRTNELFVFWAYILNLLLLLGSLYFIYKFFSEYLDKTAGIITAFFTLISPAIFNNFFMVNDFSLYFFLFFGALAYIKKFPLFVILTILTGLSRPDGLLGVSVLIAVQILRTGFYKKKIPVYFLIYVLVSFQYLLNFIFSGTLLPQGVVPQGLWHYSDILGMIISGFSTLINQIKSTFFSYYSIAQHIGFLGGPLYSGLPPLFFIFFLIGLYILKNKWKENLTFIGYIALLFLGDSFTVFSGIHLNRHITSAYPLIIGIGIYGVLNLEIKDWDLKKFFIPFFAGFFLLEFGVGFGKYILVSETALIFKDSAIWIDKHIPDKAKIFTPANVGLRYWTKGVNIITFSPAVNPILFKQSRFYRRNVEMAEFIKNIGKGVDYFYVKQNENEPNCKWLKQFSREVLYKTHFVSLGNATLFKIDLTEMYKKYIPETRNLVAELNVGDGISERQFHYKTFSVQNRYRIDGFLQKGKIDGQEYWDGGRLIDGYEQFSVDVPRNRSIEIVMLSGNKFSGYAHFRCKRTKMDILLPEINVKLIVNNTIISVKNIKQAKNFQHITFTIPPNLNSGKLKVKITGNYISFHYWVYLK